MFESLPSQFDVPRTSYNAQQNEWSIDELISILTQEEETRKKGKSHSVQFTSHKGKDKKKFHKNKGRKFQFKKKGSGDSGQHSGQQSEQHSGENSGKPKFQFNGKCKFCDMIGQKQADCWKFKSWLEKKKGNPLALVCFESNLVDVPSHTWWLDTGATIHVTNSLQEFRSRRMPNEGELMITVGNEASVKVEHIGVVSLELSTGHVLNLKDTVFVPSMRRNLIYVSVLDDCGYSFHFSSKRVSLSYDSVVVGSGNLCDGLYLLDTRSFPIDQQYPVVNTVVGKKRGRVAESSSML